MTELNRLRTLRTLVADTDTYNWADPWEKVYYLEELDQRIAVKEKTAETMKTFDTWVDSVKESHRAYQIRRTLNKLEQDWGSSAN